MRRVKQVSDDWQTAIELVSLTRQSIHIQFIQCVTGKPEATNNRKTSDCVCNIKLIPDHHTTLIHKETFLNSTNSMQHNPYMNMFNMWSHVLAHYIHGTCLFYLTIMGKRFKWKTLSFYTWWCFYPIPLLQLWFLKLKMLLQYLFTVVK